MGRKSSISRLPSEIKDALLRLIRAEAYTNAEIVAALDQMGARVSESAITRFTRTERQKMETYRRAREVAQVWAQRAEEDPNGDVAKLNLQLLSTVAFKVLSDIGEGEAKSTSPMELMLMSKSLEHAAKAEKLTIERELRIRKEVAQQAAERAVASARKAGLSAEAAAGIRRDILGIVGKTGE